MNATIQCLAHIPELSEALIQIYLNNKIDKNRFINYINSNRLTCEYTQLLINIFFPNGRQNSFAPYDLKEVIGSQESLFQNNDAEDAKDLYIFLVETMNTELNNGTPAIYNNIAKLGIDQTNQQKIKETFINEFYSKNNTPFSQLLYGFSQTCSLCKKCQTKKYNYECFNALIFPLLDIQEYTIQNNINSFNNQRNTISLNECFNYYQKAENFFGENKMYCNFCHSNQETCIQRLIDKTPPILVIILDRGYNNLDFTDNFIYDENLDLEDFVPNNNNYIKYYLSGVIVHLGESGPGGHFIAYCKMDKNSPWYIYNDSQVIKCENSDDFVKTGSPYILFYHFYNN